MINNIYMLSMIHNIYVWYPWCTIFYFWYPSYTLFAFGIPRIHVVSVWCPWYTIYKFGSSLSFYILIVALIPSNFLYVISDEVETLVCMSQSLHEISDCDPPTSTIQPLDLTAWLKAKYDHDRSKSVTSMRPHKIIYVHIDLYILL